MGDCCAHRSQLPVRVCNKAPMPMPPPIDIASNPIARCGITDRVLTDHIIRFGILRGAVGAVQRWETSAWGDANMRTLQRHDVIQLERKGYYIVDSPLYKAGKPLVLFSIPDGRTEALNATVPAAATAAAAPQQGKKAVQH